MSINFNAYGIKSNDMVSTDLEPGQTLIRIVRPKHYDSLSPIRTAEYMVVKVLKTRLVLESVEPRGILGKKHELRLIVDQKSWSARAGEVTTTNEGNSQSYSRELYEFATEDEAELIAQIISDREASIAKRVEQNELVEAVAQVRHELHAGADLAKVDAAIDALTKLRARLTAAE